MNELVSVIVPVYNTQDYLERCLTSLVHQTYKNFEIILIDDGSTDSSAEICDKWSDIYSFIKVYHYPNKGIAESRNRGIKQSVGDYITFVDSDDFLESNYIELLMDLLKKNNADISVCGYKNVYSDGRVKSFFQSLVDERIVTAKEAIRMICLQKEITVSAWAKLYKAELFDEIVYPSGKLYEDLGTTCSVFGKAKKVALQNVPLYGYFINEEGIMRSKFKSSKLDIIEMSEVMLDYITNKYPELIKEARCLHTSNLCHLYMELPEHSYNSLKKDIFKTVKKFRRDCLTTKEVRIKNKVIALSTFIGYVFFDFLLRKRRGSI